MVCTKSVKCLYRLGLVDSSNLKTLGLVLSIGDHHGSYDFTIKNKTNKTFFQPIRDFWITVEAKVDSANAQAAPQKTVAAA